VCSCHRSCVDRELPRKRALHAKPPAISAMVPYRLLSLFVNMGKQTKPICFFSKGGSGLSGKADIECCFIVGRGNMGVLLWPKRHVGMPLEQFDVTHVRPSNWPPPV